MNKIYNKNNLNSIFLLLASVALVFLSCYFAKERIVYTDTAAYFRVMLNEGGFFIATNRFISVLSQILPALGMLLGLPLKWVLLLYSLNFILFPVLGVWICYRRFRSPESAIAIILFYTLMSRWVFYYPVSEFQMGLCFLLVYHAFLLHFLNSSKRNNRVFYIVSVILIPIIIFSHPIALYAFIAWLIWLLVDYKIEGKRLLLFPVAMAFVSWFVREAFFKAIVGNLAYDEKRKEGLANFYQPIQSFFTSKLATSFYKELLGHYFILLIAFVGIILFFGYKRKWLRACYFGGMVFSFWLLVTVTFKDNKYGHYAEHLYQPIPFFISLVWGKYIFQLLKHATLRFTLLTGVFVIMVAKIFSNHKFFTERLQWYQNYITLMHEKKLKKGALSPNYVLFDTPPDYWASKDESLILSSLAGPDSSVYLIINWNPKTMNEGLSELKPINPVYFHLNRQLHYVILDSIASPDQLNYLKWQPVQQD